MLGAPAHSRVWTRAGSAGPVHPAWHALPGPAPAPGCGRGGRPCLGEPGGCQSHCWPAAASWWRRAAQPGGSVQSCGSHRGAPSLPSASAAASGPVAGPWGLRWRLDTKGPLKTCPGPFAPAPLWHITAGGTKDLPRSPCLAGETPEPRSGRAPQDHGVHSGRQQRALSSLGPRLHLLQPAPCLSACSGPVIAKAASASPETRAGEPQGARCPTTDFQMDNTTEK